MIDERRPDYNSSLLLNAGDEFQGTLFYTYYGGEKIAETLNELEFDAMTLGNHEFDGGDEELAAFLQNLTFPIVSANIESNNTILNETIKPYHIFEEYGLAVIGLTTETTPTISSPGAGTTFSNSTQAVQRTIDHIYETTNITRIAALTHIGYEEDQMLAQSTTGLYLILGGHSHTLLGDMEDAEGDYPTIVENLDGEEVFIVTAYRWGEYLGYIDVTYDPEGRVLEYHGGPIHLTNETEQDDDLQEQIEEWRVPFEAFAAEEVGQSNVELGQETCQEEECLLGDFMADAMLAYRLNDSDTADFALINAGGIRATIDEGSITRGEVLTSFPFGNAIVELTLTGEEVWTVLEGIVTGVNQNNGEEVTSFFQISTGIQVEYNPDNNNGSKLVSVTVGGEPIDNSTEYNIVTLDYLAGGGDNFFTPTTDFISLDTQETVLIAYIQQESPVDIELDGRITQVDRQRSEGAGSGSSSSSSSSGEGEDEESGSGGDGGVEQQSDENAASVVNSKFGLLVVAIALSCVV